MVSVCASDLNNTLEITGAGVSDLNDSLESRDVSVDLEYNSIDDNDSNVDVLGYGEYSDSISVDSSSILSDTVFSFSDLNESIYSQFNNGGVVKLSGNYVYSSDTDSGLRTGIILVSNMVIDGQGSTVIDAKNLARVFRANGDVSNIILKDMIIVFYHKFMSYE